MNKKYILYVVTYEDTSKENIRDNGKRETMSN